MSFGRAQRAAQEKEKRRERKRLRHRGNGTAGDRQKKKRKGKGLPVGQANTIVGNEQLEEGEREEFELKIKDNKKNRIN